MNSFARKISIGCFAAGATVVTLSSICYGQSLTEQMVGTWRMVSSYNEQNGVKTDTFGDQPLGLTMIDRAGNYIVVQSRSGLPKFAANNRQKGTDAENRAVVQGFVAGFGSYKVDGDTVTISWTASSYPNRVGTQETRTFKITGDNLVTTNPTGSSGGVTVSTFARVK